MPRKKIVKEPIEKVKDQVVLEIIEDSSDEEQENAIKVTKGAEVISEMTVGDIKEELTPKLGVNGAPPSKPEKKKRTMTDEQKAKMKAGRERKKAERALQASKAKVPPPAELKAEPSLPPAIAPATDNDDMPGWFKKYIASKEKADPQPEVKITPPVKKAPKKKATKPRSKKVVPEPVAPPKPSIRFI